MRTKLVYVADDERIFDSEIECLKHEQIVKKVEKLKESLLEIQSFCTSLPGCLDCPFLDGDCCGITFQNVEDGTSDTPYNWKMENWGKK